MNIKFKNKKIIITAAVLLVLVCLTSIGVILHNHTVQPVQNVQDNQTDANQQEDEVLQLGSLSPVSDSPLYTELTNHWKVQLPVFKEGSATSIKEVGKCCKTSFDNYCDEWFYYDKADKALVFVTNVDGAKTANSKYTRSELREMGEDSKDNWSFDGNHCMKVSEMVTKVPANGKVMVCQIHAIYPTGENGPVPVKVFYEGNEKRIDVSFSKGVKSSENRHYYFDNVELNQHFSIVMKVSDGVATVIVSSNGREETYSFNMIESDRRWLKYLNYFKAGNYIQDAEDESEGAGSVVRMYEISVEHEQDL